MAYCHLPLSESSTSRLRDWNSSKYPIRVVFRQVRILNIPAEGLEHHRAIRRGPVGAVRILNIPAEGLELIDSHIYSIGDNVRILNIPAEGLEPRQ